MCASRAMTIMGISLTSVILLQIKEEMPQEYEARQTDKLRYRYPRGESYLDVIQRLESVIVELERQSSPVLVIAHQVSLHSDVFSQAVMSQCIHSLM